MFFDQQMLEMIFEELAAELDMEITFEDWATEVGYDPSMTDETIYGLLPKEFLPFLGDFGLNASWYHGGM